MDLQVQANTPILPQDFVPSREANSVRLWISVQTALPVDLICRFTRTTPPKVVTTRIKANVANNIAQDPIIIPTRPNVTMNFALSGAATILIAFLEESYNP